MQAISYRPDIDGLRALAVLCVVAYHAFPQTLRGGFIGVDIFFVISGYLITWIILKGLNDGSFSFREFYFRRIRRIFPALIVVMVSALLFGWFVLLPTEYAALGKQTFGGSFFSANLLLWRESGYFDITSRAKPLLHLWSLGIEEQFYLFFPLMLWVCTKRRFRPAVAILALGFLSFLDNLYLRHIDRVADFYSPLSRVWELMAGAALCTIMRQASVKCLYLKIDSICEKVCFEGGGGGTNNGRSLSLVLAFIGVTLLGIALLLSREDNPWPGWKAAIPVLGTLFLIAAGPINPISKYILSNRISVFIGLISYPLYLWHWVFISFASIINGGLDHNTRVLRISLIIISFAFAIVTYYVIERPIRYGNYAKNTKTYLLSIIMVIVGIAGLIIHQSNGIATRVDGELKYLQQIRNSIVHWYFIDTFKHEYLAGDDIHYWSKMSNKSDITLFIGDSNMAHYVARIDEDIEKFPNEMNSAIILACSGTPIKVGIPSVNGFPMKDACNNYAGKALRLAKNMMDIKNVVLSEAWNSHLKKLSPGKRFEEMELLSSYIKQLIAAGKKVFVIQNVPVGTNLVPSMHVERNLLDFPNVFKINNEGITRKSLRDNFGDIEDLVGTTALNAGATVITPADFLCDDSRCRPLDEDGIAIYASDSHLTTVYVRAKANFIDQTLK